MLSHTKGVRDYTTGRIKVWISTERCTHI